MNDDIRKLVEDMDDSGAGNDETALKTDEFVKNTIKSCRLFTEPADTVKYYGKDRRDFWNDDSDEVMLLCQFFNNAIVSGDPGSVEIARTGFEQLSEKDDEMLFDVIGSVLLRHIDPDGIIELFDPEKQPEFRRYNLAVAAKTHPEILDEERRNMIFDSLKKRMKALIKDNPPETCAVFDEALILAEFGDSRAIPLLRRYAVMLLEPSEAEYSMLEDRAKSGEKIEPKEELTPSMMLWEVCNEIETLGGVADDIKAKNPFGHMLYNY